MSQVTNSRHTSKAFASAASRRRLCFANPVQHHREDFERFEMSLKQPVTQVRLTNVAVVRLKRKGKRFELACYKNKVMSWREGIEKDLDEVLQTPSIFSNVSKGILAKTKDLKDAFKTDDTDAMVLEILRRGELQVSERERQYQAENLFNEIAVIVSEKCVDPSTKRPFSVGIIERAMRDTLHFAVLPNKPAKVRYQYAILFTITTKQARELWQSLTVANVNLHFLCMRNSMSTQAQAQQVVKQLQEHMSISRAQMRLHLSIPSSKGKILKEKLKSHVQAWETEEWDPDLEATVLVDPGSFRIIEEMIREETRGQGTFEVLSLAVIEDNDEQLT